MHYDLLAKIKNAGRARRDTVQTRYSNFAFSVAQVLLKSHYLKEVQKKAVNRKNYLEVKIAYRGTKPVLDDFKIISRPGRHIYASYKDLKSVKQGYGVGIISTPAGVMSTQEARRLKVGGEYLCEVW